MASNKILHMNAGDGETSYANNSVFQKAGMSKSMHVLDETLKDMFNDEHVEFPKCFKMVDLGCSSGPNALFAMSHIMNKIGDLFKQKNITDDAMLPEFEIFLNDLPDNDFNNLFKSLPKQSGRYFVYGLPGSFYDRILPKNSINFAYSSYSVHWLSQVPEGLGNKNCENIYMAMTSPTEVYEVYAKQYKRDFFKFLSLRAAEIVSGGRMVLIFIGRSVEDPSTKDDWSTFTVLSKTLAEMVPEGHVNMDDLHSFNVPIYAPCIQEVETAIQSEGSFTLDRSDSYRLSWSDNVAPADDQSKSLVIDNHKGGKLVADFMRAFMEPMLASHFGSSIIDDLFVRYANNFAEHLSKMDGSSFHIVASLTRK